VRTQAMRPCRDRVGWAYKEAGAKGYAGVSASGEYDAVAVRQLLAWERICRCKRVAAGRGQFDDRIYVLTPNAAIVELPQGATAVDLLTACTPRWATVAGARGWLGPWCR
jgi:GTP pyrophosphokinase